MKRRAISAMLVAVLLPGCVPYPVFKTLQPAAKASVRDGQGRPVEGATVALISGAHPHGRERSRETKLTASDGTVIFPSRREWRTEVLALHGWEEYFWNWCVQKEGFKTLTTAHGSASDFEVEAVLTLTAGESEPCRQGIR